MKYTGCFYPINATEALLKTGPVDDREINDYDILPRQWFILKAIMCIHVPDTSPTELP